MTILAISAGATGVWRTALLFLGAILILCLPAGAGQYRLSPGDVLRVVIVGVPDLAQEIPIEMDGTAWFPLIGPISAGGRTLADLRSQAADAYATTSLLRPIENGRTLPQIIKAEQVYVAVASYRPIYMTGEIGTPGEVAFRPGMTLRHVLAQASPNLHEIGGRAASAGEIEAAATALAHDRARIWRAKSFLGTVTQNDSDRIFVANLPAIDELVAVERSILEETRRSLEAQKQQITDEIKRIEGRVEVLTQQREKESAALEMDEEDLENVRNLSERGLAPASRVAEARRASLVSASRALQVDVALEDARGQAAALTAEIIALDNEARQRAWKELSEAVVQAQEHQAELAKLSASAVGTASAMLLEMAPTATVFRDGVELDSSEVSPALPVLPGDVLEIRFVPADGGRAAEDG